MKFGSLCPDGSVKKNALFLRNDHVALQRGSMSEAQRAIVRGGSS